MLWSGRITLVVLISAMVLTGSSAEEEPVRKLRSTFFSSLVSESDARGNSIRHSKSRNGKEIDDRHRTPGSWDMEPLIVKLNTVFDRYEYNWGEVKKLYGSVGPCMPDKCGKIHHPKYKMPRKFKCSKFKRRKNLKHKVVRILSKFHFGVQSFSETFQNLTAFLDGCSERRPKILKEFKNDFKMLNKEIETLLTKKRLKTVTKRLVVPLSCSPTVTFLKNELMTLQHSKMFLFAWKENLSNVFKCWNKMKSRRGRGCGVRVRPGLVGPGPAGRSVPFVKQQRCPL